MKHLGKIAAIVMALIMAAAIAIGIGVIFAVKNVNITLLSYSYGNDEISDEISLIKNGVSDKCKGRVISSVKEEDVLSVLGEGYTLEKFEKVLPCTVNVTVKQRKEIFAVLNGESYYMYDENGALMREEDKNINYIDNAPNVLVEGINGEEDFKDVAEICAIFSDSSNFGVLRSVVEKVILYKPQSTISFDKAKITFVLRSGLSVEIHDYRELTSEKIAKAHKKFNELTGEEKLSGKIIVYVRTEDGALMAERNPNG